VRHQREDRQREGPKLVQGPELRQEAGLLLVGQAEGVEPEQQRRGEGLEMPLVLVMPRETQSLLPRGQLRCSLTLCEYSASD
jgi:hypothetical protein